MGETIGVVGLGYVGLPVAIAMAKKFPGTRGFDVNIAKIEQLQQGNDVTRQHSREELLESGIAFANDPEMLRGCTFFIVTVPTPINLDKKPDLTPVVRASETLGAILEPGVVVVYESTVYPGVTEDICGPVLERVSGLKRGRDFKLGYSPERINPGDQEHTFSRITKVVAGEDNETLERVAAVYKAVVEAGLHRASSIKVAEAAKVIENTQRDLNIALMNELAVIFDRLGISTGEVLAAAGTKWNFLPFTPGLVGGHCIGVDPYYLTAKAEQVGYHPQVILAGRRINDSMGEYIASKLVKLLIRAGSKVRGARIGILGITFKENVPDIRNSRVPDIVNALKEYQTEVRVCDHLADADETRKEYGIELSAQSDLDDLDCLLYAIAHEEFKQTGAQAILKKIRNPGVCIDIKGILRDAEIPEGVCYWAL